MSLDDRSVRRYLLGEASDDESAAVEREYFVDDLHLDHVGDAEERLVEDYLADRLTVSERRSFEQYYLVSPAHRVRVNAIRQLSTSTNASRIKQNHLLPPSRPVVHGVSYQWLAAAAVIVLTTGAVWMYFSRQPENRRASVDRPPASSSASATSVGEPRSNEPRATGPAAPVVFSFSLSPISVRSAVESPALVIPPGTDTVALRLEGDGGAGTMATARAVIQTVSGDEVWRGTANVGTDLPAGTIARIEVPVATLGVGDWIVTLIGTDRSEREREQHRYFLRVRPR